MLSFLHTLALSSIWAEPLTIPVQLEIPGRDRPVVAELTIPNSLSLVARIRYDGDQFVPFHSDNLPNLYEVYSTPQTRWERRTLFEKHLVWYPAHIEKTKPLLGALHITAGSKFVKLHIPYAEEMYAEEKSLQNLKDHLPLVSSRYDDSISLEYFRARPTTPFYDGEPIIFFPNGRGQRGIPAIWMASDHWNRQVFALPKDYRQYVAGGVGFLPLYASHRRMLARPFDTSLEDIKIKEEERWSKDPDEYRIGIQPWRVGDLGAQQSEDIFSTMRAFVRMGHLLSPCGDIFQLIPPRGFDPLKN